MCATFIGTLSYWPQGETSGDCYGIDASNCYMEPVPIVWWCVAFSVSGLLVIFLFWEALGLCAKIVRMEEQNVNSTAVDYQNL